MSQGWWYSGRMNLTSRTRRSFVPLALLWTHERVAYRLTAWPEAQLERLYGCDWIAIGSAAEPSRAALARVEPAAWRAYLEFVPLEVREFVALFRSNRIAALQISARCPELVGALTETPALTAFVAAHAALRGADAPRWSELNGVFERSGVYGLLDWLGLPASRQTLAVLRNLVACDIPEHLLAPLRAKLWLPSGVFALAQLPAITDEQLAEACNALAA